MPTYFHDWRRKFGIVTLVLACVFMAGWVKSYDADYLVGFMQRCLISVKGGLIFESPAQQSSTQRREFIFLSRKLKKYKFIGSEFEGPLPEDKWRIQWAGFTVAEYDVTVTLMNGTLLDETNRFYRIPYWSIVIPLTLLSAYLLISKPPAPHQKKITDPIHVDGA